MIFNRVDNFHDRLHDLEVHMLRSSASGGADEDVLCGKFDGVAPGKMEPGGDGGAVVVDCQTPLKADRVKVMIKGEAEILTVCEIQVFQVNVHPRECFQNEFKVFTIFVCTPLNRFLRCDKAPL